MEDLVKNVGLISSRLEEMKEYRDDINGRITKLEKEQSELVQQLIETNGRGVVMMGDIRYLPFERHDGTFGLRRL